MEINKEILSSLIDEENRDYLNNYSGVLPSYLLIYVDIEEYDKNLKKNGIYDETYKEYYRIRCDRLKCDDMEEYDKSELIKWIDENYKLIKDNIIK